MDYQDGAEAQRSLGRYFRHYNRERPHQALDYRTPAEVHGQGAMKRAPRHLRSGGATSTVGSGRSLSTFASSPIRPVCVVFYEPV